MYFIKVMDFRFSITILDKKVKIFKFTREQYDVNYKLFSRCDDVMCQTFLEDEITIYKYTTDHDEKFMAICDAFDVRNYNIINIHEDLPGIDHIGIVNYISKIFLDAKIPLLYINTYSYNLILICEDFLDTAIKVLENIVNK